TSYISPTTVYHSVLFTVNDMSNTSNGPGGGFVYGLASQIAGVGTFTGSNLTVLGAALSTRHDQVDSTKFNVGLRAGGSTIWDSADAFALGTPVFIVLGYTINNLGPMDV